VRGYFCTLPTSVARLAPLHYTLLRVFTYTLGHHGCQHLLANLIALVDHGPACEGQSEGKGALVVFCPVWPGSALVVNYPVLHWRQRSIRRRDSP
jgi:membrane associated rhomboid family serine protease